jgi:hypothetical protein
MATYPKLRKQIYSGNEIYVICEAQTGLNLMKPFSGKNKK